MLPKYKKLTLAIILAIFVTVSSIGTLGMPTPAKAQFVVTEAASIPQAVKLILDKVLEGLKIGVLNVAGTAVSYALRKIAYDSAVWIASGGKGQSALLFRKGFATYLKDVGDDAIGHGIDELGAKWGYNLCKIPNPQVDLALRESLRIGIGINNTSDPTRKPSCTLTQFYENNLSGDSWKSRYSSFTSSVESQFNQALNFDIGQGDLGIQMQAAEQILRKVAEAKEGSYVDVLKGGGAKDLVDKVSGNIKLPASSVATELEGISNKERVSKAENQINTAISTGQFQILPGALGSFFLNTLAGTLLKNFQEKGILPFGLGCSGGGTACIDGESAENFEGIPTYGGRRVAQQFFNDFLSAKISSVDEYNILGQLNNCPDNPGLYNCRADDKLIQAAQEFTNGNPLTIHEAIEKGFLDGNKKLIPPIRAAENASPDCYKDSYCHSNVKVLRQLRILPLGFEIAAEQSDPDKPWTLKQIVDGFTDCDYIRNNGQIVGIRYNPIKFPFCHLIDPNWVIKAPATRCSAYVYGPSVLSQEVPDRLQDCANLSTCVAYNKDGNCVNYAYCTREKNTWKFNADQCDSQYRTCKSFVDDKGNNQAYLYRTLDTGYCNKDNVGCKTYTFNQNDKGEWIPPTTNAVSYLNNGIYFNKNVSTACSAGSAGCSAFKVASSTQNLLYLRQAPDYLKCYDTNSATPEVEWPKTTSDLSKLNPKPGCKDYAGACIPEEVNCNWYTPSEALTTNSKIPGRYTQADVCDAKCVGYAAYREMPSNYSNGESVSYIIPSSGNSCAAEDDGCSGFTNLGTTSGGVEQVEYFSYLRTCSLPDAARQKNFITYEGSTLGGFQLKTFTLIKDQNGGPQYFYRTPDDASQYQNICNENLYKAGLASLDCRQFNDEEGKIYYRLLSKTIPVSESCTPYRLNETDLYPVAATQAQCALQKGYWNNNQCQICLQGGEYRDGSCFYFGLPENSGTTAGASKVCAQSANSCRAYKGNSGNNIKDIFNENFESTATSSLTAWKGQVNLSPESTHVGEHSLGYTGAGEIYRELTLTPGKTYDLTFWAKGSGQTLTISLRSADGKFSKQFSQTGVGDVWNYYHVGPVEFDGTAQAAQLVFKNQVNGKLFIDNVKLTEMVDNLYLVKNSLKVDPVCDSNLNDNLPGEALGCSAYKDPVNTTVNLTGFTQLCREGAIGCTALFNTQNTINDEGPRVYNIWLKGPANGRVELKVGTDLASCQVLAGETGCYTNLFGHDAKEILAASSTVFVSSTIYIPSDTSSSSPVYLVANKEASCNAVDLGCSYAGTEAPSSVGAKYSTILVKNDPATYENTLCQKEAVGCNAYTGSQGISYFKDPYISGQRICTYRTGVTVNNSRYDGWFWKGVGVCSNDSKKTCTNNQECGGANTCVNIGEVPCYSNYIVDGANYGLWSYGDKGKYQNYVGECPVEQDQCTEFKDQNDNNRSYYFIKNQKLSEGNCEGSVSEREGCALFDQTDNPNKYWVTKDSYLASEAAQFKLTKPVEGSTQNPGDANVIFKVQLDRECGEWLQCRSSHRVWDQQNGKWKNVCDQIGRCTRAPENPEEDNVSNCAEWVEEDPIYSNQVLSPETYAKRDISWKGMDFSGYSLLNTFPLETLDQVNISSLNSKPDWRLAKLIPCGDTNCAPNVDPEDFNCQTNGSSCGKGGDGICINGTCMVNVNGEAKDLFTSSPQQACRAYPEKDSPFPNSTFIDKAKNQFQGANICNETARPSSDKAKAEKCECDYTKAKYGEAITKYWSYSKPHNTEEVIKGAKDKVPAGICLGGSRDGASCDSDTDCYRTDTGQPDGKMILGIDKNSITDGSCQKQKSLTKLLGWRGFCLEKDESRNINGEENSHPCLTWLPVDYLSGTQDIDNQHTEAGYRPPAIMGGIGGAFYCLVGNSSGNIEQGKSYPGGHLLVSRPASSTLRASDDDGQNGRAHIDPTPEEAKLTQFDIEKIIFKVVDKENLNNEDPKAATTFEIWPNDTVTQAGEFQGKYSTKGHVREPGVALTGKFLGKDYQYILAYGSSVGDGGEPEKYIFESGKVCYPSAEWAGWGGRVSGWDINGNNCWDLNGNIFTQLKSRKGGLAYGSGNRSNNNSPGVEGRDYVVTEMNSDGLWERTPDDSDWKFTEDEICRSYGANPAGSINHEGNWHMVRVKFDPETRKFLGFDTFFCDQSKDGGYIGYEVTFKLRQWCPKVADVLADPTSYEENTSPWTNRLWKTGFVIGERDLQLGGFKGPAYHFGFTYSPFASLGLNSITKPYNPIILTPYQKKQNCGVSELGLNSCEFSPGVTEQQPYQENVAGGPYSCPNGVCVRMDNALNPNPNPNSPCVKIDDKNVECFTGANGLSEAEGKSYLAKIFARVRKVLEFSPKIQNNGSYVGYALSTSTQTLDVTETVNPIPKVPWVFPAVDCKSDGVCIEDNSAPGVTVNGVKDKDVRIPAPSARIFLRFFAYADSDQMPLRQIKVDWDEKTGVEPEGIPGLYRNHRGYKQPVCKLDQNGRNGKCEMQIMDELTMCSRDTDCGAGGKCILSGPGSAVGRCLVTRQTTSCQNQDDCELTPTCVDESKAPYFGYQLDKTCDNNYVQFIHVYQCSKASAQYEPDTVKCDGKDANATAFPRGCCIFKPTVQVKDNWGWCNGKCGDANSPGKEGCYDATSRNGGNECERSAASASTPFQGRIILSPPLK